MVKAAEAFDKQVYTGASLLKSGGCNLIRSEPDLETRIIVLFPLTFTFNVVFTNLILLLCNNDSSLKPTASFGTHFFYLCI